MGKKRILLRFQFLSSTSGSLCDRHLLSKTRRQVFDVARAAHQHNCCRTARITCYMEVSQLLAQGTVLQISSHHASVAHNERRGQRQAPIEELSGFRDQSLRGFSQQPHYTPFRSSKARFRQAGFFRLDFIRKIYITASRSNAYQLKTDP